MFKLYKKDGSEVSFTTEEGMEKTLKAFPNKYKSDSKIEKKTKKEEIEELELIPETVIDEPVEIIEED